MNPPRRSIPIGEGYLSKMAPGDVRLPPTRPDPLHVKITAKDGRVLLESDKVAHVKDQIMDVLRRESGSEGPREFGRKVFSQMREQERAAYEKFASELGLSDAEDDGHLAPREIAGRVLLDSADWHGRWTQDGPRLERAASSRLHDYVEAAAAGRLYRIGKFGDEARVDVGSSSDDVGPSFVIRHDWNAAFLGAEDFVEDAERRLPFDPCAFEMQLSGRRVIALAKSGGDGYLLAIIAECDDPRGSWVCFHENIVRMVPGLHRVVARQVAAACVALDAEVAVAEVIRAPERLNRAREKAGKLPLFDYRVVDLSRRRKAAALAPEDEKTPGRRRRLHFRRGHWRRYETHKTWIKWMLVGDPDLGWIDKEYRL